MADSAKDYARLGYSLLDSGEEQKLERFGSKVISRPSSLAIWRRRKGQDVWGKWDAQYHPDGGWAFRTKTFNEWEMDLGSFRLELRLQNNGQLGLFPDHLNYLPDLLKAVKACGKSHPQVLNLFAYTGMASMALAKVGCEVCHVDLSKQALSWARRNMDINDLSSREESAGVRLIPEDAVKFTERELRRGNRYDLIIADPPSFGRLGKGKSWSLDEIALQLVDNCFKLLAPKHGSLFLTCHHSVMGQEVLNNLLLDHAPEDARITTRNLALPEQDTKRLLPAGYLAICS